MGACTAEIEIGEIQIAVRAAAQTDEAFAAARALVHGVRHSVSSDALGRSRATLGMVPRVAAITTHAAESAIPSIPSQINGCTARPSSANVLDFIRFSMRCERLQRVR